MEESLGAFLSRIQTGFCETVAKVMDAEVEGEDAIHPSKRTRVAGRVSPHVPSEVDPQNRDFNVQQILRSSPNPVVASVGDSERVPRALVRRGFLGMKHRFPNFEDDIHDQPVTERITDTIPRIPSRLLMLAFPSRIWLCHLSSPQERSDGERAAVLAILNSVASSCEVQETAGNLFLVEKPVGATSWNKTFHSEASERSLCS